MYIHPTLLKNNLLGILRMAANVGLIFLGLFYLYTLTNVLTAIIVCGSYVLLVVVSDIWEEAYQRFAWEERLKMMEEDREDE